MSLDGTISRGDLTRIYQNALAISDVEDLGLAVGAHLHQSAHGPLGVATFSGPDLSTALELLAKYDQTRTDFFDITLSKHPDGMKVNFSETFNLGALRAFVTESVFSGLFAAIDFFVGADQFNGQVYFSYPEPSYGQKYRNCFGNNIEFNHPATEIVVPRLLLSVPSLVADSVLHQEAVATCEQQLKQIQGRDIEDRGVCMADW